MSRHDENDMSVFDITPVHVNWTDDGHVAEESIYAWLDNALGHSDSVLIATHVEDCAECKAAVAEARGFIAASVRIMNAADLAPKGVVSRDEVVRATARIVALAGGGETTNRFTASERVETVANGGTRSTRRPGESWGAISRIAAVLLVAVGSYFTMREKPRAREQNATPAAASIPVQPETTTNAATPPTPVLKPESNVAQKANSRNAQPSKRAIEANRRRLQAQNLPGINVQAQANTTEQKKLAFTVATVAAQDRPSTRTITGTVTDSKTNTPISMANIFVSGTPMVATTDDKGAFTLRDVPAAARTLVVRRIGYGLAEIPIDSIYSSTRTITAALSASEAMLDAVSVTSAERSGRGKKEQNSCIAITAELMGSHQPIVYGVETRPLTNGRYDATIIGWPNSSSRTKTELTVGADKTVTGRMQTVGRSLEIELVQRGEFWYGTVREYRGRDIRSENMKYLPDLTARECR